MKRITFLGTGGARIMMSKQLLDTGGIWLKLGDTEISLDPGPGALVHAIHHRLQPTNLAGIILSHRHLDHSGDVNAMIEAMTGGGTSRKGIVFAPEDALKEDPVVLHYLRKYVHQITALRPEQNYRLGSVTFSTSMPLRHGPVETYGFKFSFEGLTCAFLPDTAYFKELETFFKGDVLVVNALLVQRRKVPHLSVPDVQKLLEAVKPKVAILTHFGMQMWHTGPAQVAARLSDKTGIQVIAALDGMHYDLD